MSENGLGETDRISMLQDRVNRLHAKRGPLVDLARTYRMRFGIASQEFAQKWGEVEAVTYELSVAEEALERELEADASRPHPEREIAEENPTSRAVSSAMTLCDLIDALPDEEASKVIEALKRRLIESILKKGKVRA